MNESSETVQPSQIQLVSENPDSDETMCIVDEDLLERFVAIEQDGWVMEMTIVVWSNLREVDHD